MTWTRGLARGDLVVSPLEMTPPLLGFTARAINSAGFPVTVDHLLVSLPRGT